MVTAESMVSIVVSAIGAFLAWLIADARSKARLQYGEEKFEALNIECDKMTLKMSACEINIARSEQDRVEIHKAIEKLDSAKASKEIVDGIKNDISSLKDEMDKRFDRIERLLENNGRITTKNKRCKNNKRNK